MIIEYAVKKYENKQTKPIFETNNLFVCFDYTISSDIILKWWVDFLT